MTTGATRTLPLGGSLMLLDPWLPAEESDALFAFLLEAIPWEQRSVRLFRREVAQPRLVAWMGDADAVYTYSGLRLVPKPWPTPVAKLRDRITVITGEPFNAVLLNLYRDGRDSMGMHADDEPELGNDPIVASVSLGAIRTFVLKPRQKRGSIRPIRIELGHGSLLVMGRGTQRAWSHGVPKQPSVTGARVNLTFRQVRHEGRRSVQEA